MSKKIDVSYLKKIQCSSQYVLNENSIFPEHVIEKAHIDDMMGYLIKKLQEENLFKLEKSVDDKDIVTLKMSLFVYDINKEQKEDHGNRIHITGSEPDEI